MDVQGSRNLVHEQLLESGKETTKQLKAVAQTFCVFIAWMTFFSHMDEIGYTFWAIFSSAVFPVMKAIVTINICLLQILMCLLLRAIVGWMISVIILTIARIPEVIFLLSVLPVNMFMNMICNGINNGASIWREINKYPPNTRHLRPVGTRVGFYGERITFGGKSSSPRNHRSRFGGYLGYYALKVLSVLHDLALLHATCIDIGWPIMYLGATGLLYLLVGSYAHSPRRAPSPAPLSPGAIPRPVQDPILPTQRLQMRTDCILSTQRYAARAALRADGKGIVRSLFKVNYNIIC